MKPLHRLHACLGLFLLCAGVQLSGAQQAEVIAPKTDTGLAVLLISGVSGTALYQDYARAIADLGYTAVLVSGSDISNQVGEPSENLRRVVTALRSDPRVKPGKIGVIGFSLGGGGALLHAASQPELFSMVIAYYPAVTRLPSIEETARRVRVPTMILAGEKDRYNNCCLIESVREFESTAKSAGRPVEVYSYPDADHGFNLDVPSFRAQDAADAWSRVQAFLLAHHAR